MAFSWLDGGIGARGDQLRDEGLTDGIEETSDDLPMRPDAGSA